MENYYQFIFYLTVYRLAIIFCGIASVYLGYKLLVKGVFDNPADVKGEFAHIKLTIKNASPGTLFALFGVILICTMIVQGSPQIVIDNLKKANLHSIRNEEFRDSLNKNTDSLNNKQLIEKKVTDHLNKNEISNLIKNEIERQTLTFRGDVEAKTIANYTMHGKAFEKHKDYYSATQQYSMAVLTIAEPINALAWRKFKDNKMEEADNLSKIAIQLVPDNENFLDTYAEIQYGKKNFEVALEYMEKAYTLTSNPLSKQEFKIKSDLYRKAMSKE